MASIPKRDLRNFITIQERIIAQYRLEIKDYPQLKSTNEKLILQCEGKIHAFTLLLNTY